MLFHKHFSKLPAVFVCAFASAYGLDYTESAQLTGVTNYSSYMNENQESANGAWETAKIYITGGANINVTGNQGAFIGDVSTMISLGMNDSTAVPPHSGGYRSNDNMGMFFSGAKLDIVGTLDLSQGGNATGSFIGIGAKKTWTTRDGLAFPISVDIEINTAERSRIELNYNLASNAAFVSAVYAENLVNWSGSTSVKLSNIDIAVNSMSPSTTYGAAVTVRGDGNTPSVAGAGTAVYEGTSSVEIATSGAKIHGVVVSGMNSNSGFQPNLILTNRGKVTTNGEGSHALLVEASYGKAQITNSGSLSASGGGSYAILVRKREPIAVATAAVDLIMDGSANIAGDIDLGTGTRLMDIKNTRQNVDGHIAFAKGDSAPGVGDAVFRVSVDSLSAYGVLDVASMDITDALLDLVFDPSIEMGDYARFDIIIADSLEGKFANAADTFVANIDGVAYEFNVDYTNGVSLIYGTMPEPSTYAAIFGALTLGFAVYRNRKNTHSK